MLPPLALHVIAGFTAPLTEAEKVVAVPTVLVGLAGATADTTTGLTLIVRIEVTMVPLSTLKV
jgi:ATP-dependent protease HslVU (ClpYQ) peptidase subunit